jgi:hypothetical protein
VDLNNDGHRDILSGSYSRMEGSMAGLFQVLWGGGGGKFKAATVLNGTDKQPLIIPAGKEEDVERICTRPTAADWNGDGKLDLVVGNFAGTFYVFPGVDKGKFAPKPEPLMAGQSRLRMKGHHSDPFPVDWDGDGDVDLLSGSSEGGVQWAENTGGKVPALKEFEWLIEPRPRREMGQRVNESELTEPSDSTRVWVEDVNGDGKLDILVGDRVTLVSMASGITEAEYAEKLAKWRKEYNAASEAMTKASGDEEKRAAQKNFSEVYGRRTEFMKQDMTGYVWLYRQK